MTNPHIDREEDAMSGDRTDVIAPARPGRRGLRVLWALVGIITALGLAVSFVLILWASGIGSGRTDIAAKVLPTNPPSPSAPATVVGTWRIVRVPGVQTGIHIPGEDPPTVVVTKTVPGPAVTTTVRVPVPGPTVTVTKTCTVTVVAAATPPPSPAPDPEPSCTTPTP